MESYFYTIVRQPGIAMLKSYPIPQHISFIVDGNRTYSKKTGISFTDVYDKGADGIIHQIRTCSQLNVKIISVYLFSLYNFKRNEEEIKPIFQSFIRMFRKIINEPYGGCYKMVGDQTKFPDHLHTVALKLENATRENSKFFVYFALGYAGKNELVEATMKIQKEISHPSEVTTELVDRYMTIPRSETNPMLTIRTSNSRRLSEFLTWQSSFSIIYFVDKMWPEFNDWDLFKAILHYQQHCRKCIKVEDKLKLIERTVSNPK